MPLGSLSGLGGGGGRFKRLDILLPLATAENQRFSSKTCGLVRSINTFHVRRCRCPVKGALDGGCRFRRKMLNDDILKPYS